MSKKPHPYQEFEGSKLWQILEQGIDDLVENQDLEEKTPRPYIVGYLARLLTESRLLPVEQPLGRKSRRKS